ncbi:hypothetical protein [Pseudomonas sp. CDFA 610]|uniref:hypothetical protein n=1 Tax=Pseudomonas sp. CDFA 610 TaxID=2829825 RepID=UPI001E513E53|nr:hypothetical protein [Pseudomonas sp. CDFA 610]MCD5984373.1 hypothetical protein [Pseudomonas sp. CDFA 610]
MRAVDPEIRGPDDEWQKWFHFVQEGPDCPVLKALHLIESMPDRRFSAPGFLKGAIDKNDALIK